MRIFDIFSRFCTAASAVIFAMSLSLLNAFCVHDETVSSPQTVMTGGESNISIIIGIVLLAIGTVGFVILKIKEREKS